MTIPGLDLRPQLWCALCGFVFPLLVLVLLFGTGVLPPQSPHHSAAQIAAWYRDDNTLKLVAFAGSSAALALLIPLTVAITVQMFRIEGRSPAMSLLQFAGGMFTWVLTIVPMIILCIAAYRPDRNPEITQALNDFGWIMFFMGLAPFAVQDVAIAVGILRDRSAVPVYPRWVAWFNLWVAFLFIPALAIPFFKVGPFSYRGLLAFWVPTLIYGAWAMLMALMTRRAILAQAREEGVVPDTPSPVAEPVAA